MQQREARDRNVRRIEYIIRHEKQIAEAVREARLSVFGQPEIPGGGSAISKPTEAMAIRLADELQEVVVDGRPVEQPERWLKVISAVREWCGQDVIRAEIFKRRYSGEGYIRTCYDLHIVQQTYSVFLRDIRDFAIKCACQMQLIKVF